MCRIGQHHRDREQKACDGRNGCRQKGGEHIQPDHRTKAAVQLGRALRQRTCHNNEHQHRGNALQCTDEQAAQLADPARARRNKRQHRTDCQTDQDAQDQAGLVVLCNNRFQGFHIVTLLLYCTPIAYIFLFLAREQLSL